MIKHIVMIKLKSFSTMDEKNMAANRIKSSLEGLKSKIEELKFIEVGLNINPSERASDIVLVSEFESLETLNVYRVHPEHKKTLAIINEYADKITAVDYEV